MSVFWLQPIAWWGFAALAIPVVIHLLVRHRSRRLYFPSLRFLRATRLAAIRRRTLSDWPLLMVRLLIIGLAAAALAIPVFVSAERQRSWSARVARAIVRAPAADSSEARTTPDITGLIAEEQADAFVSATFSPASTTADGIRDAVIWLAAQPPASREVVIVGDLRAGSLTGRDLDLVAPAIGVRFMPVTTAGRERTLQFQAIAAANEGFALHNLSVRLEDESTDVSYAIGNGAPELPIEVHASSADQPRVSAALRAVLAEGVLLHHPDRRVAVTFGDASSPPAVETFVPFASFVPPKAAWMRRSLELLPEHRGSERDDRLVVVAGVPGTDPRVPEVIARVTNVVFGEDLRRHEPRVIPAATLASWSRTPAPGSDDVRPQDEGDRRYLWGAVLVLLALEQWMRRSRPVGVAGRDDGSVSDDATPGREVRVA